MDENSNIQAVPGPLQPSKKYSLSEYLPLFFIIVVVVLSIIGGLLWLRLRGNSKTITVGSKNVSVNLTSLSKTGIEVEDATLKDFLDKAAKDQKDKNIKVNFVNAFPSEENNDILVFWPESVWGESGMACGKASFSEDGKKGELNFYITKDKVIEASNKEEAAVLVNDFFRYCLQAALAGKSAGDDALKNDYESLKVEYKDKILINLK